MAELLHLVLHWAFMAWSAAMVLASVLLLWLAVARLVHKAANRAVGLAAMFEVLREMRAQGRLGPWAKRWIKGSDDGG